MFVCLKSINQTNNIGKFSANVFSINISISLLSFGTTLVYQGFTLCFTLFIIIDLCMLDLNFCMFQYFSMKTLSTIFSCILCCFSATRSLQFFQKQGLVNCGRQGKQKVALIKPVSIFHAVLRDQRLLVEWKAQNSATRI